MSKISIIIPVYNAEQYVEQCLACCTAQTVSEWEVVAVDDGSTDGSGDLLDRCAERDARIQVVHTFNQGVTWARRIAVEHSSGEWLFFLDSDDTIPPTALERLLGEAQTAEADLVVGDFLYISPGGKVLRRQENRIGGDALQAALRFEATGNLCGRLVRRELIQQIDWPSAEIKIGEDMVCGLQLLSLSHKTTAYTAEPIYNYIQYPDSTINSRNPAKVASMIPYLRWIDRYFGTQSDDLRAAADFFILNEYFAYLMYGGRWEAEAEMRAIFARCRKKALPLKIRLAFSPLGKGLVAAARRVKR